jgi:3-hydroxyisobutyrate dehydrogenase-like beta-hydroxyacid dehydrogenase
MSHDLGTVGFIGLGAMGKPMAVNLAKAGYTLLAYDINKETYKDFNGQPNVRTAEALGQFAECGTTILIVPNSRVVNRVVLEEGGLIGVLREDSTIIDMTSSVASSTRSLGKALEAKKINLIDAPVSGGAVGAANATLGIMVGGRHDLYECFLPLLRAMGNNVRYVGELGCGHLIKALNNLLSATTFIATAEVLLLGKKMGLSAQTMLDVFNASTSRSYATEVKFPKHILSRTFDINGTVETYYKDMRNALDCATAYDVPQLLGNLNEQIWRTAVSRGLEKEDYTVIVKLMEETAGIEIKD